MRFCPEIPNKYMTQNKNFKITIKITDVDPVLYTSIYLLKVMIPQQTLKY